MTFRVRRPFIVFLVSALALYAARNQIIPRGEDLQYLVQSFAYRHPVLVSKIMLNIPHEETRLDIIEWFGQTDDIAGVTPLIDCLGSRSENIRLAAIRSLGSLQDPRAVRPLIKILSHDAVLRNYAAISLVHIGASAAEELSNLLDHPDKCVRLETVQALSRIHAGIVDEAFFKAMDDSLPLIRAIAAASLALSGYEGFADTVIRLNETETNWISMEPEILALDSLAVPALIRAASSSDLAFRETAIIYLGMFADKRAKGVLLERLNDSYVFTKMAAAEALAKIGDPSIAPALLDAYINEPTHFAKPIGEALISLWGEPKVHELYPFIDSPNDTLRWRAVELIAASADSEAMNALVPLLQDPVCRIRKHAIKAVESLRIPESLVLMDALQDSCEEIRIAAIKAVGRLRIKRAVPVLKEIVQKDTKQIRIVAIDALGNIGDPGAIAILIDAMKDQDSDVLKHVLDGLISAKSAVPLGKILHLVNSGDPGIRSRTALILGNSDDADAKSALVGIMKDENTSVACSAVQALGIVGGDETVEFLADAYSERKTLGKSYIDALATIRTPSAIKLLVDALGDRNAKIRESAETALRKLWPVSSEALADKGLKHNNPLTRFRVARIMLQLGDYRAVPVMVQSMGSDSEPLRDQAIIEISEVYDHAFAELESAAASRDVFVRLGACSLLLLNDRKGYARPILRELSNPDPEIRYWAVHALRLADDSEFASNLRSLIHDDDPNIRKEVLIALCRFGERGSTEVMAEFIMSELKSHEYTPGWTVGSVLNYVDYFVKTHGAAAMDALTNRLDDAPVWLQYEIWDEISEAEDTTTTRYFVALTRNTSPLLVQFSRSALVKLGESALKALRPRINDDCKETRRAAGYVMGKIGNAEDLPLIEQLIKDKKRIVRLEAARAKSRLDNRLNRERYPRRKPAYDHWYSGGIERD